MPGTLYFIRNQDLYKIGITQDIDRRMGELKPDEVVATLVTAYYKEYEKEMHQRYKHCRIPQTEYFRLTQDEVKEVLYEMTQDGVPAWVNQSRRDAKTNWAFSAITLLVAVASIWLPSLIEKVLHGWFWEWGFSLIGIVSFLFFLWRSIKHLCLAVRWSMKGLFDWAWWKAKENANP